MICILSNVYGIDMIKNSNVNYKVVIDPKVSVSELIKKGIFKSVNENISESAFTFAKDGPHEILVEFKTFNSIKNFKNAIDEINKLNYRPATAQEVLALRAQHNTIPNKDISKIIALGTTLKIQGSNHALVIEYWEKSFICPGGKCSETPERIDLSITNLELFPPKDLFFAIVKKS
jgi:hypothetical protein